MHNKPPEPAPAGTPTGQQPQIIYYVVQPPPPGPGIPYGPYSQYQAQPPGDEESVNEPIPEGFGASFDEHEVRRAFIRKVYIILSIQVLISGAIVCLFLFIKPMNHFLRVNWWFSIIPSFLMMIFVCMLICCELRRSFPVNYIILTLFSISGGLVAAGPCVYYSLYAVLVALIVTILICWTVSFVACFCPVDVTGCGCMLLIALFSFTMFSLISFIVMLFIGKVRILQFIIAGIGTALFSMYLLYDTQLIMGGKKVEISPEEHIVAVIQLYYDILLIFTYVLQLIGLIEGD